MSEMFKGNDKEKIARVTQAFLKMKKFDIADLCSPAPIAKQFSARPEPPEQRPARLAEHSAARTTTRHKLARVVFRQGEIKIPANTKR